MPNLIDTLARLDEQVVRAFAEAKHVKIPATYKSIDRVVVMAMGGSALGVHLIQSALRDRTTVPIEIENGYDLPATATKSSLIILSSFSGTTEEILSAYKQAKLKGLKMFVLTNGGPLVDMARRDRVPAYVFDPKDLAPQPRYGTGFMALGPLAVLCAVGAVKVSNKEIAEVAKHLRVGVGVWKREASGIAKKLFQRGCLFVSSEHLEGAAHVFANQMNESAKHFAARFTIPEMNHHLMEGLTFPKMLVSGMTFVFCESDLYHARVSKRYGLTETVIKKNGAKTLRLKMAGKTPLQQAFELVQRGALITAKMAELGHVNPEDIHWVDWFKAQMK